MTEKFDSSYDVVIVGSGASGLSCAVQAAKDGLTCAVLEKEAQVGGSSMFAEGHAAFESDEQEKRGITVTKEEGFNTFIEYSHRRANAALVSRYVDNAATTIKKMRDEVGVEYKGVSGVTAGDPNELKTWHNPVGDIARVIELLEADARRRGVDIFLATRGTTILQDEAGKVVGLVAADSDGQQVRLGAKAVVVATGGYAGNPEMIDKYTGFPGLGSKMISVGGPGCVGDGITMVLEAGGTETPSIGAAMVFPFVRGKTLTSHVYCAGYQPYFWVNAYGRRFTSEAVGLNVLAAGDLVVTLPQSRYWQILDSAMIRHLVEDGNDIGLGVYIENGAKLIHLPTEIEADAADPSRENVHSAATIVELAAKIAVDPQVLTAEVDAYNALCESGHDAQFFKPVEYLRPVSEPPFYAIMGEPGTFGTTGSLKVDEYWRSLDKQGRVIPGLYVVGVEAGGWCGDSYINPIPGASNGHALTSGWLVADDIAERLQASSL